MENNKLHCHYCGREIKPGQEVSMELSQKDGLYYENGVPAGHESQGWFDVGSGCATLLRRERSNKDISPSFDPF